MVAKGSKKAHASEICKQLDSVRPAPGYYIYGEEMYWHREIVQLLRKHFPGGVERLEGEETNWNDIGNQVAQGSFFGTQLWVVSNGQHLFDKTPVSCPPLPDNGNCLVLSVPVREKVKAVPKPFVKEWESYGGLTVIAPQLKGYETGKWISGRFREDGYVISPQAIQALIITCGKDMSRLENEIRKVKMYHGKNLLEKNITDTEVLACVSPDPESNMFGIEDAVGNRDIKKMFREYEDLHSKGISHFLIISVIASYIRLIWRVKFAMKDKKSPNLIGEHLGIHPFRAKKAMEQCSNWTLDDLEASLRLLCETDYSIKKGEADMGSSMGRLLIGLCGYGQD